MGLVLYGVSTIDVITKTNESIFIMKYIFIIHHSFFSSALTFDLPLVSLTFNSAALWTNVALFLADRLCANSPKRLEKKKLCMSKYLQILYYLSKEFQALWGF